MVSRGEKRMARGAIVAARRRGTVLVAALAGCLASACAGERATRPARPAGGGIAATVSVDAATPGLQVQLSAEAQRGATVLVATHLLAEWEGKVDACVLLRSGQVGGALPPDRLRESFQSFDGASGI